MDFEQIRAFLNVASLKSFSAAAEKLFVSQPSISVRIKSLEEELGVVLFDRSKAREPSLTDSGKIFLNYAQSLVNLQEECRNKLSDRLECAEGTIFIGASTVPGTYLLPKLLASFSKEYPGVEYRVDILDTSAVMEGLLNYSYDLGLVGQLVKDGRLEYRALVEDELLLCTCRDLLPEVGADKSVSLKHCLKFHLLLREKGSATRRLLEKNLHRQNYTLDNFAGVTCFNSLEGIKEAVRHGLGISFLSRLSVQDMLAAGLIDGFEVEGFQVNRALYLAYNRSRVLPGAAEKLKNYTAGYYEEAAACFE